MGCLDIGSARVAVGRPPLADRKLAVNSRWHWNAEQMEYLDTEQYARGGYGSQLTDSNAENTLSTWRS